MTPLSTLTLPAPQSELSLLGTTIRAELAAVARTGAEMLSHAFAVGEALNRVKEIVGHGHWGDWISAEYGLSARSAGDYMRLAYHRAVLEQNRQHAADLSIRAALRRIGSGMTVRNRKRPSASALKAVLWKAAAKEEREVFVSGIPLIEWLAAMPASWRIDLVDRIDGLRASLAKPVMKSITKSAMMRRAA